MLNAFISSLHLAGDHAILMLHNASETLRAEGPVWPATNRDMADMRLRDLEKVNLLVRAVWYGLASGLFHVVVSDVDVQLFPGWSEVTRGCASESHICIMQQPGVYGERNYPFNSGFMALRPDWLCLETLLDYAAEFEPQFLLPEDVLSKHYILEQEVLSQYLIDRGDGLWGAFNPEIVRIMVEIWSIPVDVLKVKVQHACGSAATNRLKNMYRARRLYYSIYPICLSSNASGPEHPCCMILGHRRSIYESHLPRLPPFYHGSIFGISQRQPDDPDHFLACTIHEMPGGDAEDHASWRYSCDELMKLRGLQWQLENPEEEFLMR